MNTSEWMKKISFREGFFLSAVLAVVAYYIFDFVQVPVLQTWWYDGLIAVACVLALCLFFDFGTPSKERDERMQIIAGLSLTLLLLAGLGMLYYLFIADAPISGPIFGGMMIVSFVVYAFLLFLVCFAFFQSDERKEKANNDIQRNND